MSEYKRLTTDSGGSIACLNCEEDGYTPAMQYCMGCEHKNNLSKKLRDFEIIGSPEEFAELAKAKAEGRLVVLSTPMIPLVQSDDLMDSDVYCPACGKTLSGGWPDYHPDQEWTMCQCFHCGQSIDDTKVVTKEEAEVALKIGGGQ